MWRLGGGLWQKNLCAQKKHHRGSARGMPPTSLRAPEQGRLVGVDVNVGIGVVVGAFKLGGIHHQEDHHRHYDRRIHRKIRSNKQQQPAIC